MSPNLNVVSQVFLSSKQVFIKHNPLPTAKFINPTILSFTRLIRSVMWTFPKPPTSLVFPNKFHKIAPSLLKISQSLGNKKVISLKQHPQWKPYHFHCHITISFSNYILLNQSVSNYHTHSIFCFITLTPNELKTIDNHLALWPFHQTSCRLQIST